MCSFFLAAATPSSGRRVLHSINGEEIRADDEGDQLAPTAVNDQDRRHGTRISDAAQASRAAGDSMVPTTNAVTTGKKECLGGIEHDRDADDQKRDQREGDHLAAANGRRQFAFALVRRRIHRFIRNGRVVLGKDTQLRSPLKQALISTANTADITGLGTGTMPCEAANYAPL